MKAKRLAVLSVASSAADAGGAERLYAGLVEALRGEGFEADLIAGISDESSFESIQASYLNFYDMDLSAYDGVISTKAPTYAARHPNHVCYLMHTIRVFYDMFPVERPHPSQADHEQRDFIHRIDRLCLSPERIRQIHTVGEEVRLRLMDSLGLNGKVLRHPTNMEGLRPRDAALPEGEAPYFLCAGRLHRWKRVDLAIQAMREISEDARLIITGVGEDAEWFKTLAEGDDRIIFLGRVDEAKLLELYAGALAVIFSPLREDLGLVTLEAYACSRPVITCEDSGEPGRIVQHMVTGMVTAPTPAAMAEAMRHYIHHPDQAAAMGRRGLELSQSINWRSVARALTASLAPGLEEKANPSDA
jgi:glycosyltransferase involved in cell wall biosynthesis